MSAEITAGGTTSGPFQESNDIHAAATNTCLPVKGSIAKKGLT
jgi:hypothetical protein